MAAAARRVHADRRSRRHRGGNPEWRLRLLLWPREPGLLPPALFHASERKFIKGSNVLKRRGSQRQRAPPGAALLLGTHLWRCRASGWESPAAPRPQKRTHTQTGASCALVVKRRVQWTPALKLLSSSSSMTSATNGPLALPQAQERGDQSKKPPPSPPAKG